MLMQTMAEEEKKEKEEIVVHILDDMVHIKEEPVDEEYLSEPVSGSASENYFPVVPEGGGSVKEEKGTHKTKDDAFLFTYKSMAFVSHENGVQPMKVTGRCYECYKCHQHFKLYRDLNRHLVAKHHGEKAFKCMECCQCFPSNSDLRIHMKIHTGEPTFQCDVCGKVLATKGSLGLHKITHNKHKPYKCNICGHQFAQKGNLVRHIPRHYTKEKLTIDNTGHVLSNRFKRYSCNVCGKRFSQKLSLTHHATLHTGEEPYQCAQCNKKFAYKASLVNHMKLHTNGKPYMCKDCGQNYASRRELKEHIVTIHSGEKTFQCANCKREFSKNADLIVHMRKHSGEKPFKCNLCSKQYPTKGTLKIHSRIHSKEKHFTCEVCSKTFAQKGNFKRHMERHTFQESRSSIASTFGDALVIMEKAMARDKIDINDRQLACARINSQEGQDYLKGMAAAANYAWVNRSSMTFLTRQAFAKVFKTTPDDLDMQMIYDVSHNIAKIEEHLVDGKLKTLLVHRKGSTRAFPPHHPLIPVDYQLSGQPVLIGGSMGTCSYVLTGTEFGMKETFGTTCHGAGRALSRAKSRRNIDYLQVLENLKEMGIAIRVASPKLVMEEAPESYKNVTDVVDTCHAAGISKKAIKLKPIAVIKG